MIPFEIKTIISGNEGLDSDHTIYLFNKEKKILLPIKINQNSVDALLLARETTPEPRPHIHNTAKRLINVLNGKVDRIIISGYNNEIYYSYIRIKQGKKSFDIDARPTDAFAIAIRTKAPIYVEQDIIDMVGVKVTAEMLE